MNNIRTIVIDLLDDPHGVDELKFRNLTNFVRLNYPGTCDDVFSAAHGADDRVWLDEDVAIELRSDVT